MGRHIEIRTDKMPSTEKSISMALAPIPFSTELQLNGLYATIVVRESFGSVQPLSLAPISNRQLMLEYPVTVSNKNAGLEAQALSVRLPDVPPASPEQKKKDGDNGSVSLKLEHDDESKHLDTASKRSASQASDESDEGDD